MLSLCGYLGCEVVIECSGAPVSKWCPLTSVNVLGTRIITTLDVTDAFLHYNPNPNASTNNLE
jgi:hypothetical protein